MASQRVIKANRAIVVERFIKPRGSSGSETGLRFPVTPK